MAKKISKFFRIGVEGDTCDGRIIDGNDIQQMADTFDPRVYGCRINLEHIKGLLPDSPFRRYGDVVELKAEKINDDSALNGKWALYAKVVPTEDLVAMVQARQKVYTSMEIRPNFSNSGKCYLIGLAVTDDPASLGTEMLEFCARAKTNPLAGKKLEPTDLFSVAVEAAIEFEEIPESGISLLSRVKELFNRKQSSDDARFTDVHAAVTTVAEQLQVQADINEQRFQQIEQQIEANQQQLSHLHASLDHSESLIQLRRPMANGGNGDETFLTNC
ncbi:phage capsid scaffolding protein [Yersinia frederiksenii]|uniref:GPO family capsid scaffolding protein n=1 Tax=Yersinia alsatica TaxID=2890317 RepID=UPI0005E9099B|nr:GPO family capsid scaffolding protein [Yersinia alsatica]OVZ89884.1 capsid scaffolding protein [Yersinia frederiksenii]CNH40450.1 phage capsid scaffolding protein [Yersinia frederiksenii]